MRSWLIPQWLRITIGTMFLIVTVAEAIFHQWLVATVCLILTGIQVAALAGHKKRL